MRSVTKSARRKYAHAKSRVVYYSPHMMIYADQDNVKFVLRHWYVKSNDLPDINTVPFPSNLLDAMRKGSPGVMDL